MMDTRIDMLKQLTNISGEDIDTEILETYIPKYYAHIYSFYSLLNSCLISYRNIKFESPIVVGETITICFSMTGDDFKILSKEIKTVDGYIKYLRGHSFNIVLTGTHNTARLTFSR